MSEKQAKKGPVVVSILNLKGGVGKTTVAALLARYASGTGGYNMALAPKKLDVLAVDLDPQANFSQALMGESEYKKFHHQKHPTVVELFGGYVPPSTDNASPVPVSPEHVVRNVVGNLDVIPSRFDFSDKLVNSAGVNKMALAQFIGKHMAHKDLVVIDCAPTESVLTHAAYHASRYVLIPVRTEFLSTIGFPLMHESLDEFRGNNHAHTIEICGIFINQNRTRKVPKGPHHRAALSDICGFSEQFQWPVYRNSVHHSDGFPKWVKDTGATRLGNAPEEWSMVAPEIMWSMGFLGYDRWAFSCCRESSSRFGEERREEAMKECTKLTGQLSESQVTVWEKRQRLDDFFAKLEGGNTT